MEQMHWNILDLANQLRQERLFVNSEQQQLQNLNEKVLCASSKLAQLAWVAAQQRENLNRLIVARPDCTPAACCQKANAMEATEFVDAYKVLGFQESLAYGELLSNLCLAPQLLASCLVVGDRVLPPECMTKVAHSVYSGLLGSSLLPEDKLLALRLLRHLTELQLVPSDNPRRLLRQKSCAFARLYSEFHEGLFSAKLFLTAALHKPIMQLLMEDEMFLDIDPDKATVRFPPEERLKRFGTEGTAEHATQLAEYRKWTIGCLVRVTNRFVSSIRENMHCFPTSVRWLVRQIAGLLTQNGSIEPKEVHAICTDLIFTHFICPAIVNPEPYGITDAPISYIARFNLIQVAQIVQTLAMTRYEEVSAKVADLYSKFEKDCVSSILDIMLDGVGASVNEEPATIEGGKLQGLVRSCALFTEQELHNFIHFLQSVASSETNDAVDQKQLRAFLAQLPSTAAATVNGNAPQPTASSSKLIPPSNDTHKRGGLLGKVSRSRTSSAPPSPGRGEASDDGGLDEEVVDRPSQDVLLIPFGSSASENVGFLSEQKVLCGSEGRCAAPEGSLPNGVDVASVVATGVERSESQEKRTRFSLLHDEGSIGNTSDNLEAVSEAASNHSVASSLELENEDQNDNLSDMVSANVSGRGTPNISEGEEGPGGMLRGAVEVRPALDFHPQAQNKQSRSDIDDKFGKFEIKKLLEGDETVSMVSDTWSTDVLASDSETIEQSERSFPSGSITESTIQQLSEATQLLDVSETASEAWSTDVLASDSERMTEVDTDDTGSVARSDDTARSEIEVESRGEPEGGEETPLSQASLNLNSSFRPIREDPPIGRAGLVPPSPTRVDIAVHPSWNSSSRAKTEYRRRIAEYVDSNSNNVGQRREPQDLKSAEDAPKLIHVIDKMDKPLEQKAASASVNQAATSIVNVPNPLVLVPNGPAQLIPNGNLMLHSNGPVPLTPNRSSHPTPNGLSNHIPLQSNCVSSPPETSSSAPPSPLVGPAVQISCGRPLAAAAKLPVELVTPPTDSASGVKQEALIEDDALSRESAVGDSILSTVRLSSASLASSSSSTGSSSDPRPKTATPTPELPLVAPYSTMNGHAMMAEGDNRPLKSVVQSSCATSSSTGAIPKSISFDKTAERGDKDLLDEDSKHKRGFFRNFKLAFKPRRVKSGRADDTRCYESLTGDGDLPHRLRRMSEEAHSSRHDTTEDILAKYRRKPSTSSETTASETLTEPLNQIKVKQQSEDRLSIDPRNVEASDAFADAKRKLRMVLSTADLQHAPWSSQKGAKFSPKDNELVSFLQLQLAEAINLQDHSLISHLHETLRCIRLFDDNGCCKLFQSLHDDYQKRSPYIAYLVRSRKGLLSTLAHFERLTERVKKDHNVCSRFLIAVCVTLFLEKREGMMLQFQEEFQLLTLADEKTDLLDNFLQTLAIEMERDPTWQAASETQLDQARAAIERAVIGRVYIQALYPNGDGDISRDQVLHDHMKKLSNVITPNHKDLRIPKRYHYECPWPSAQAEIAAISAYKTPRDKLQCVFRCATTIMNLLAMAWEGSVPAADDFVPVLVYVLIKANPPSLLSTVQYVDSFYGSRLEGEEQYWWIQFCSAIEFIKTMDYGD